MTASYPIEGKVALVTGASSGIGLACALRLHQLGYKVYGASRRIHPAASIPFTSLPMNVDDDESVRAALAKLISAEARIDVVVNCAGFGVAGAVEETSIADAKAQFETNFFGVLRVCQQVLPTMRKQGSGVIIQMSSLAGLTGLPFQGLYSASKFALEGMSESMRMELAPFGIRVVLVEPGDFATGFADRGLRSQVSLTASAYAHSDAAIARMEQDERNGPAPEVVARLVERILQTASPNLRYKSGLFIQTFGVGLKRVVPYALYEKAMKKMYG
jgi:NAD(P)-dependent dehydrogenase (short-subunit alcohol dehydrogenase family)